jgi:hypothetical protein
MEHIVTEESQRYARLKWIVESNARGQANKDSKEFPQERLQESVDPYTYEEAHGVLRAWAQGPKKWLVFAGASQLDIETVSPYEMNELIEHWIEFYLDLVFTQLRERYERESNATA